MGEPFSARGQVQVGAVGLAKYAMAMIKTSHEGLINAVRTHPRARAHNPRTP